jgi:exodeoxyribonuclease VII large subunit
MIRLINTGKDFIIRSGITPVNQASRLLSYARNYTGNLRSSLGNIELSLFRNAISLTKKRETEINSLKNSLNLLSPLNVLKRGYTITSGNGKIMTSAERVKNGDLIDTMFFDGIIKSKVTDKSARPGDDK